MMRVWLVDDDLPYDKLIPVPDKVEKSGLEYLIRTEATWSEDLPVRDLCNKLTQDADVELTVLSAPAVLTKYLDSSMLPPNVVIFDWEGAGFKPESNLAAIETTLECTFAYVQIYTHLSVDSVEVHLGAIRDKYQGRLLPAKSKHELNAEALFELVKSEYAKTIAGEIADEARSRIRRALEQTLVELCSVPTSVLAQLTQGQVGQAEGLFSLVASKLRDGLASEGSGFIGDALTQVEVAPGQSTDALRRFQSIWYYYFPTDQLVRRGDIARTRSGDIVLIISAQCDLARFQKKTAKYLTLATMVELTKANVQTIGNTCQHYRLRAVGGSPIASHAEFSHAFIVLPNVPTEHGSRDGIKDYLVRCHALQSVEVPRAEKMDLKYSETDGLVRVCTLTESFAAAVVSHLVATLSAAGMPDFPTFEQQRLQQLLS